MEPAVRSEAADAPGIRDGVVSRPGLFERLARARRVVQVSAPPGSGKTILLRSWIAATGPAGRAAWVSVPGEVRDPQRLWIPVVGALRDTAPGAPLVRGLRPRLTWMAGRWSSGCWTTSPRWKSRSGW